MKRSPTVRPSRPPTSGHFAISRGFSPARFSGVSQQVKVPVQAVLAIYAQETGQGMMLPRDDSELEPPPSPEPPDPSEPSEDAPKRSHLRVVK